MADTSTPHPHSVSTTPLQAYAAWLLAERLDDFASLTLTLMRRFEVPLLQWYTHLDEETSQAQQRESSRHFLQGFIEGRELALMRESLAAWEADALPGLRRDQISLDDIVLIHAAQRQSLLQMLPGYAGDVEEAIALVTAVEAHFVQVQRETLALYARMREEAARLAAAHEEAMAEAEELQAVNEELQAQQEELQAQQEEIEAQQEELETLNEELREHNTRIEAIVEARTRDLRETAERLRASERKLQEAQRVASIGSWEWDMRANRVSWSDELYRIYGLEPGQFEATFEAFVERLLPEDRERVTGRIYAAVESCGRFDNDERVRRPDGTVRHLRSWGEVVVDDQGAPMRMIGICQDVTEQMAADQELRARTAALEEANARLRETDRYKDEFLAVISHELRTPLNFIVSFGSVLDDELAGPLNDSQRTYLSRMLAGADRMLLLVNNLLDMSRMQAGRFQLAPEPCVFPALVDEVFATMSTLATQKGVSLTAEVGVDQPIHCDGQRVIQVLTNLVDNAIKFTPDGGSVTVRASVAGDVLRCEVEDTGCGIAPADQAKLFQRFVQVDMSSTRQAGGTGLGLSISKGLVEAHGGTITLESEPGRGTTFRFELPVSAAR